MTAIWSFGLARPRLALVLLCLAVLVPGLTTLPPLDRDESRYAQATRQMLETGDFIEIRYQEDARNKKPVLIYWLQAGANAGLSSPPYAEIWIYRLPSVLGAGLAVLFTFGLGSLLFSREAGLLGAGLLAASLLVIGEGHIAKTDAVLLATIVGAQWALAAAVLRRGRPVSWGTGIGFWAALGLGILVKGPVAPFVVGATALTLGLWRRDWSFLPALRPLSGLAVLAGILLPWGIAILIETDGRFFIDALGGDFGGKITGGQEKHGVPVPIFWLTVWIFLWPAVLFLLPGLVEVWRQRGEPEMQVLIAWVVPAWIVFELVPTKLPHYPLPLYPALALAAALAVLSAARAPEVWRRRISLRVSSMIYALVGVILASAMIALPIVYGEGLPPWPALVLAPLLGAAVLALAASVWRGQMLQAAIGSILVAAVTASSLFLIVVPSLTALQTSPRAAALVTAQLGHDHAPVAVAGYAEPSLVFLLGTRTQLGPGAAAAEYLAAHPERAALVSDAERPAFDAALAARGLAVEELGAVSGLNYSKGDSVRLVLLRVKPPV